MLTGGLYIHALPPVMIRFSSTGMTTAMCLLLRPYFKWSEFTPNMIPVISSSKSLIPSCVMLPTIQAILSFER